MMIMMVNYGVDTFSLIIPKQKYHAASEIIDEITKRGYEREIGKDEYNLNKYCFLLEFNDQGIRLNITATVMHGGNTELIITPGIILGDNEDPTRLYTGAKEEWKKVRKMYNENLNLKSLPKNLNKYVLSRIDQTLDLILNDTETVDMWVHVFKKSMKSPVYQRKKFTKRTSSNPEESNRHSVEYCTSTKKKDHKKGKTFNKAPETAFKAYNKSYESPNSCALSAILRLELTSKKQPIIKKLKLDKNAEIETILNEAAKKAYKTICKFVQRSMFIDGKILPYTEAMRLVQDSKENRKQKKRMCELIEQCSKCSNLFHAFEKMALNKKAQTRLLKRFANLNLSPVTINKASAIKFKKLDSIRELLEI